MLRFIVRRLLGAIPVLFGLSIILFAFVHLLPGRPGDGDPRPARDPRACRRDARVPGPRQAALAAVPRATSDNLLHGDLGVEHHQQPAGPRGAPDPLPGDDRADRRRACSSRPASASRSAATPPATPRAGRTARSRSSRCSGISIPVFVLGLTPAVHLRRPARPAAGVRPDRPARAPRDRGRTSC